jgi:pyruvate, water dikinase
LEKRVACQPPNQETLQDDTKLMMFEKVLCGIAAGKRSAAGGRVTIVMVETDCRKVMDGDVMVVDEMEPDFIPAARRAIALISNRGGISSHTAIVGRELCKPTVVGTGNATSMLKDGLIARVDARKGTVYLRL